MTKPITIPNTFASATSAIPLAQLDQDFSTLANATNDLATYSNYVADTGAADAYIANFPANTNTSSLTAGLTVQFKAANANTGASTLNVQVNGASIGTAAIRYANGSALAAGAIAAGAMVSVMYDGTNFQLINDPAGQSGGDVTGPASATDNAIARFDGASGKLIQNSVVTIADTTGDMSGIGNLTINGTTVTCSNGLNFDSNTLVIDAANNNVGIGTSSPSYRLDILGAAVGNNAVQALAQLQSASDALSNSVEILFTPIISGQTRTAIGGIRDGSTSNAHLYFSTNNTERMRITSGGDLLIGTTSALVSNSGRGNITLNGSSDSILSFGIGGSNSGYIYSSSGGLEMNAVGSRVMTFVTNSTERMRITSAGDIYVNSNANIYAGTFQSNARGTDAALMGKSSEWSVWTQFIWNATTANDSRFIAFGTEGTYTQRGDIDYNRGAGQVRYNTTSDATLKNIIGDSDGQKSVYILKSTRIREYAWKNDESQKPQIGVIAQELYETYKGAVSVGGEFEKTDNEGNVTKEYMPWGVDKTAFTFHLIAGWQAHEKLIQEQQAMIVELTNRIKKLEGA